MRCLKNVLKVIISKTPLRIIFVNLLRLNLISKRFKNLIFLEGSYKILNYSSVTLFNTKDDSVTRDYSIFGVPDREKFFLDYLIENIDEYKTFLDIGAGFGLYSLILFKESKGLTVTAFEPNKKVFDIFLKNVEINKIEKKYITASNQAVSNVNSKIDFFIPKGDDFSYGTTNKNFLNKIGINFDKTEVASTNLEELKEQSFDLIKVDVEGHELEVVEALLDYLDKCTTILIEIENENYAKVSSVLSSKDFKLESSFEGINNYIFIKNKKL